MPKHDNPARSIGSQSTPGWRLDYLRLLSQPLLIVLSVVAIGITLQSVFRYSLGLTLSLAAISGTALFLSSLVKIPLTVRRALAFLAFACLGAALYENEQAAIYPDTLAKHASQQWQPIVIEGVVRGPLRYRPRTGPIATGAKPRVTSIIEASNAATLSTENASSATVSPSVSASSGEGIGQEWITLLPLDVRAVVDGMEQREVHGRVTVVIDSFEERFLPGDILRISGRIALIGPARNPGEPDYQEMMRRRGELVRFRGEGVESIEHLGIDWKSNLWNRWLAYLGQQGRHQLQRHIPEPECSLAAALLLGQREQVDDFTTEKLMATGTIHLLSISGLHVEMIAVSLLLFSMLLRIPRRLTLLSTAILILIYAMITGSNPPVVRATVLILGVLAGRWLGRTASAFNMLGLAGIALLAYQPSLLFDLGTQLSFLAVFCLVTLSSKLVELDRLDSSEAGRNSTDDKSIPVGWTSHLLRWIRTKWWPWINSLASLNIGVWLATAPLVLYHFHVISPIALLLNILLWLPVLIAMLSGLGTMLLGWVPGVGEAMGWICKSSMRSITYLVDWGFDIPGGHAWLPAPSWLWLIGSYLLILLAALWLMPTLRRRWVALALVGLWLLIGCADGLVGKAGLWTSGDRYLLTSNTKPGELRIQILDVGHGSAVILRLPDQTAWLYDAGRLGDQQQVYKMISQALWELRIARLDGMILSHADADHYNAMPGIIRRFRVDRFVTAPEQWSHPSNAIQTLHQQILRRSIPLSVWQAGDRYELGGASLRVLHPNAKQLEGTDNAKSLCLLIEYAGRSILLPGDLENPGTGQLLSQPPLHCDFIMAPHHGSLSESPAPMLQWCDAGSVLISGSERADTEAVRKEYGIEGRHVLVTARVHALEICISQAGKVQLSHWDNGAWQEFDEADWVRQRVQ